MGVNSNICSQGGGVKEILTKEDDRILMLKTSWFSLKYTGRLKKTQTKDLEKLQFFCFIILSSKEKYLCSKKTEVSPVVLYIITFHSSNYWRRYIWLICRLDSININIPDNSMMFQMSSVCRKVWLYNIRAVEINYMQNDQAELNFLGI